MDWETQVGQRTDVKFFFFKTVTYEVHVKVNYDPGEREALWRTGNGETILAKGEDATTLDDFMKHPKQFYKLGFKTQTEAQAYASLLNLALNSLGQYVHQTKNDPKKPTLEQWVQT